MGVYIKGMRMPETCDDCPFLDESGDFPMCQLTMTTRLAEKCECCPLSSTIVEASKVVLEEGSIEGYPVKELMAFASACRRAEITEENLHDFMFNAEMIYETLYNNFVISLEKSLDSTLKGGSHEKS